MQAVITFHPPRGQDKGCDIAAFTEPNNHTEVERYPKPDVQRSPFLGLTFGLPAD